MADDDEEVMIENFPLHKYLISNNVIESNGNNIEKDFVTPDHIPSKSSSSQETKDFHNRISITDHRAVLAHIILNSGFMFPEQISDLDSIIDIEKIKVGRLVSLGETLFFTAIVFAGIGSVLFSKQNFTLLKILMSVLAGLSITKLLKVQRKFSDRNTLRKLIATLEHLWNMSRKTLTYISESELLLKNKSFKENISLTDADLIDLDSIDDRLLLTELRKKYFIILNDVSMSFRKSLNYIRTAVTLIPGVNEGDFSNVNGDDIRGVLLVPTLEELKKAHYILLLLQSECLRRLFLSHVTELWDRDNDLALNGVMTCLTKLTRFIQEKISNLDIVLKEAFRVNESKKLCELSSVPSKFKRNNESFLTFTNKFLIKSDTHLFSALNDLRMLNAMVGNHETSEIENVKKFQNDVLERMLALKQSLDSFILSYNDNLTFLQSTIKPLPEDIRILNYTESNTNEETVKKTGISVGKSCFKPNNEDEVFISLSGPSVSERSLVSDNDDYEHVPVPLPKSVLSELKGALKEKRREWVEREKKVLGAAQVNFEFDGFGPDQENVLNPTIYNSKSKTKAEYHAPLDGMDEHDIEACTSNAYICNRSQNSDDSPSPQLNYNAPMTLPPSFINNIRLAQEKFKLNTDEEVFDD